jgi:ABC-type multidrug transport system fused ATPase/permease subunit
LAQPTFIPGGYCQLAAVLCQITMPLLVRQLLQVLENHPGQKVIHQGMGYTIGIFLTLVVNALATHRHRHLALKTGIVLRSSLVVVLYRRMLQLTTGGRLGLSLGEVSTLVAIDTQKLFEVTQEAHLIWSMPLSMILVMICLLTIMGPTTLVGLIVLFLFLPIFERIGRNIQAARQSRVKLTDQRVDIVNAMLQGVSKSGDSLFEVQTNF